MVLKATSGGYMKIKCDTVAFPYSKFDLLEFQFLNRVKCGLEILNGAFQK